MFIVFKGFLTNYKSTKVCINATDIVSVDLNKAISKVNTADLKPYINVYIRGCDSNGYCFKFNTLEAATNVYNDILKVLDNNIANIGMVEVDLSKYKDEPEDMDGHENNRTRYYPNPDSLSYRRK